ncbi:MAG: hypothetical protein ACXWPV_10915, partial [Candidatus Limnocylindrales bacterium]
HEQLGRYLAVDAAAVQAPCADAFAADNRALITDVPREEQDSGGEAAQMAAAEAEAAGGEGRREP